jgi:hypothetical protein
MTRAAHRDQSLEGTWSAKFGCTAISFLVAMDQATGGRVGPSIDVDDFRARQPDQEGGIDLIDGKIAAASFGVPFAVWAAYGSDHRAATFEELVEFGRAGRPLVIQGDHDQLPGALRCDAFTGDHAVMSRGWRATVHGRDWDVSNSLCDDWTIWPDDVMRAYTGKLAGAGRAFVAVGPLEEVPVPPLPIIDRSPVLIAIPAGRQLFDVAGAPKVKVSNVAGAYSPFGTELADVAYRAAFIETGGVLQLLLARTADCAIRPAPDTDDDEQAVLDRIAAGLEELQAEVEAAREPD